MKEFFVELVFDSWTGKLPELRGSAVGERHLIYEGDGILLDLLMRALHNGVSLQIGGQIMPTGDPPEVVSNLLVLLESGAACSQTRTNMLGEFGFEQVPADASIDISIVFPGRRFVVRSLNSKEPHNWQVILPRTGKTTREKMR